jgi:hypothetical protein
VSYSRNPITLRRIYDSIAPLGAGRNLRWITPDPRDKGWAARWAYKVREGLSIAALYPERFPELAAVAPNVKVEVLGSVVEARLLTLAAPSTPVPVAVLTDRLISFEEEP